ncbi:4'-phosphopantetheinyl transferase family protein [Balneola vulgaris]|uniref:4'-phosphopantetheinyl transferase family protein n=1 Tax=Balneola vulgaris TaxID=287535 RepID=UPI0003795CEF|nr:4'-phosphopantetheinyl transferase superfamily protein [Balneola vulgaris]
MQLISTDQISGAPKQLIIGASSIQKSLDTSILSPLELKEWNEFKHDHRKAEFLTTRHLYHALVREYLEGRTISSNELCKHEQGKPYALINGEELYVSFAHTRTHVFAAISKTLDIGIDAENIGRSIHPRLLDRILNEQEYALKEECDPILLWTAKEAVVKLLGTGLRTNLNAITLKKCTENEFLVRINDENSFQICSFRELDHQISIAY